MPFNLYEDIQINEYTGLVQDPLVAKAASLTSVWVEVKNKLGVRAPGFP